MKSRRGAIRLLSGMEVCSCGGHRRAESHFNEKPDHVQTGQEGAGADEETFIFSLISVSEMLQLRDSSFAGRRGFPRQSELEWARSYMISAIRSAKSSMPLSILTVNIFAILIRSLSDPSFTSTIGMSLMAVGPQGIMHIANHKIGSSPRIGILDARPQTTETEMADQSTNLVMSTRVAGMHGTLPPSSPRFTFRRAEDSVTPATTTCRVTNSWPRFLSDAVSHEVS
jgi:hypothetical protein